MTDASLVLQFRQHLRECVRCELSSQCNSPVPFYGDLNPPYAILGEAPSLTDDQKSIPFTGDNGNILRHWLKITGFDHRDFTYLFAVSCRPPRSGAPNHEHVTACRGWMNGQLEFIRPKVLITMGVVAFQSLRGGQRWPDLKMMHGKMYRHPVYEFDVMSTYHPASYLRGKNKAYEDKIIADLTALRQWDGLVDEVCVVCGAEVYNWDEWRVAYCGKHSARQGLLFPEDEGKVMI